MAEVTVTVTLTKAEYRALRDAVETFDKLLLPSAGRVTAQKAVSAWNKIQRAWSTGRTPAVMPGAPARNGRRVEEGPTHRLSETVLADLEAGREKRRRRQALDPGLAPASRIQVVSGGLPTLGKGKR